MLVLDTHMLLWWVSDDSLLSAAAQQAIDQCLAAEEALLVSAISAWEIAMLVQKKRLLLSMDMQRWLDTVAEIDGLRFVAIDPAIAIQAPALPGEFHKDPADRLIVATARHYSATLLTADQKILDYPHVKTCG